MIVLTLIKKCCDIKLFPASACAMNGKISYFLVVNTIKCSNLKCSTLDLLHFLRLRELLHQEVFNVKQQTPSITQAEPRVAWFKSLYHISYLMFFWKKSFQGDHKIMTNLPCAADSPLGCHIGYQWKVSEVSTGVTQNHHQGETQDRFW